MSKREELDARLSIAEAALAGAEIGSPDVGSGWTKANPTLNHLRVYCHQLRAVLAELDSSESTGNIDKARAYCRQLRTVLLELNSSATIPFRCDAPTCAVLRSPRTACWLDHLERVIATPHSLDTSSNNPIAVRAPAPDHAVHRSVRDFSAQTLSSNDALAILKLLRQAIGLLAVILAYLLYFHTDVQLQILSLPSVFLL